MKRTVIPIDFRPHVKGSKIVNQKNEMHQNFSFLMDPLKRRGFIYDLAKGQKFFSDNDQEYYRDCVLDLFPTLKSKEK